MEHSHKNRIEQHKSMSGGLRRVDSGLMSEADMSVSPNKNVNWMNTPGTWGFYVVILILARLFLSLVGFRAGMGWTVLNVFHGVVSATAKPPREPSLARAPPTLRACAASRTRSPLPPPHSPPQATFIIMHWIKGSPDDMSQGDYNGLTWWEQLGSEAWSANKKFYALVPTVLCLIASVSTDYDRSHLMANVPLWLLLVVAKLPGMEGVRIFGWNTTPGIDDEKTD